MMNDIPYFNAKFLIQKYMKLSQSDINTNEKMQEKKKKEDDEKRKTDGDLGGMDDKY